MHCIDNNVIKTFERAWFRLLPAIIDWVVRYVTNGTSVSNYEKHEEKTILNRDNFSAHSKNNNQSTLQNKEKT